MGKGALLCTCSCVAIIARNCLCCVYSTVLVNRGWAPMSYFKRGDDSINPNPGSVVTVTGIPREGETVLPFDYAL